MTTPKIFITRPFPGTGIELLKQHFDVKLNSSDRTLSPSQLKQAVKEMDAIVCLLTDKIDIHILNAAGKNLKLIANYSVGYDNIDVKTAHERHIVVTNTPDVLSNAVAEHAFALALAVARRLVEADRFTRANRYKQWEPDLLLGHELTGKTLGVIGLGRIGVRLAQLAQAFAMKTIYFDELRRKKIEQEENIEFYQFERVLREADVISLHLPLLPTTKHLIGETQLAMMKPTAILINTARGPIVHEAALINALRQKKIFGAGLDVFEREPQISRQLEKLDNVVLTPHIASASQEARLAMSQLVADNVVAFFKKGRAVTPVEVT